VEYIDLPRDYPYRSLMFRGHLVDYHPYGVISNVKMNCDAGKVLPFDMETQDLLEVLKEVNPRFSYRISDHLGDGSYFYSVLEEKEDVSLNVEDTLDCVASYYNYEYGRQVVHVYVAGAVHAGYVNIGAHVHGSCPFGYIQVPFGDPALPADWFQSKNFGSVRFEATGAVAAGEAALVLEQERPY
jgi:hypothetical protein